MKHAQQLQQLVNQALDQMTKEQNPYFYPMIKTSTGYNRAQDEIIRYAITNQLSVGAAISQLESTYAE